MATPNPNWPLNTTQFSTGAPFDGSTPSWVDISSRVRNFSGSRGRQYELDTIQAGEATFTVDDKDEALNPTNPASPYYPNVAPYKQIVDQAMWPPAPVVTADSVTLRQVTSATGTASSYTIQVPPDAQVGDDLLLVATTCGNNVYPTPSQSGWIVVHGGTTTSSGAVSLGLWRRSLTAVDISAGSFSCTYTASYTFTALLVGVKPKLGQTPCYTIVTGQGAVESASGTSHTTPAMTVSYQSAALVGLWVQGDTSPGWAAGPTGDTVVAQVTSGATSGNNSAVMVTASSIVGPGTYTRTATTSAATANALMSLVTVSVDNAVNLLNSPAGYDPTFDSYSAGSLPSWAKAVGGTSPTVSTTTPYQGSRCMSASVAAGATSQGMAFTVPCIPGQQYIASAYVKQTAANTVAISSDGTAVNTSTASTTVSGSYQRLAITFAATQTSHVVQVATTGTAVAATVYVDAVQLEPAAPSVTNPSTFSTNGPTIYGVFNGYVERWPSSWQYQGTFGQSQIAAVDALAVMSNRIMQSEYVNAVMAKSPDYYWRLDEQAGASAFAETSGNGGPALVTVNSKYGILTPEPGTASNMPGDPSGTGVLFTQGATVNASNTTGSCLGAGQWARTNTISMGGDFGWDLTVAFWVTVTTPRPTSRFDKLVACVNGRTGIHYVNPIYVGINSDGTVNAAWVNASNTSPSSIADGRPHLIIVTVLSAGVQGQTGYGNLWIDGNLVNSASGGCGVVLGSATEVQVGAGFSLNSFTQAFGGNISHVALWRRAISVAECNDLWSAAQGHPNEGSGARLNRYLGYASWKGPTSVDAGASTMGVGTIDRNTSLLQACQDIALTENGRLWADGGGTLRFQARTAQYLNVSPTWVLGEQEAPYQGNIQYDYDPQLVYNDVRVTQAGGSTVVGGTPSAISASVNKYGTHSYTRTINPYSINEAQDAANWIFLGHSDPHQRVAGVTINPSANPALWPIALGAKIGDRVTLKRRTSAGYTMAADYFIERIEHNRAPGAWTVSFQMSPTAGNTLQPWILGDSKYGVLGTSTVLAY